MNSRDLRHDSQDSCQRGYVALITAFGLSLTLSAFAIAASASGLSARLNTSAAEQRLEAAHHARSCVTIALLRLAQDVQYRPAPEGTLFLIDDSLHAACVVESIESAGAHHTIETSARVGRITSRAAAVITVPSDGMPRIEYWQ